MGVSGLPADYQRFSSPPVQPNVNNAEYQRFTSPPAGTHTIQAQHNMYAGISDSQTSQFPGVQQQQYSQQAQQGHNNMQQPPWSQFAGVNDVTAQMGMQFGRSAVAAGQDYMNKNVCLPFRDLLAIMDHG